MAPISPTLVVYVPQSVTFSVFISQTYYIIFKLPKKQKHNNTQKICRRQGFIITRNMRARTGYTLCRKTEHI